MRRAKALLQKLGLQNASKRSVVIGALIIVALVSFLIGRNTVPQTFYQNTQESAPAVKIKQDINREFKFSVKNNSGVEITKIRYIIQSANLQNEIILKGQRASAVKGRTFLIVNLKITNDSDKTIQLNTRDYLRLSVNNSKELLAPDIHNDPVLIQAISTKYTRLGFPINDTDKNLKLSVGEIDGKKTIVDLSLTHS